MSRIRKSTFFHDIRDVIKLVHSTSKKILPIIVLNSFINATIPYINIVFSYLILGGLLDHKEKSVILFYVFWMILTNFIVGVISKSLNKISRILNQEVALHVNTRIANKSLSLDYEQLEAKENMELLQIAKDGANSSGGLVQFCESLAGVIKDIASILYAIILLIPLFSGSLYVGNSYWNHFFASSWSSVTLIGIYSFFTVLNFLLLNRYSKAMYHFFDANVEFNRVGYYFMEQLLGDYKNGKDFRIYNMHNLIINEANRVNEAGFVQFKKMSKAQAETDSICFGIDSINLFISFSFVGIKAILGFINIASVLKFVTTLTTLSTACKYLLEKVVFIHIQIKYLKNFMKFLDLPNVKYQGQLPIEKRDDNEYEIEFKNVSFHYPNSEDIILNHVSYKLKIGSKVAIVGPNGAGKTTFIKLLCRLYDPTEGEILLNGINIKKFDYQEYLRIFSVVFQDFKLFSFTIAQNIAANTVYDENQIWDALEKSGVGKRVEAMEQKIYTPIYQTDEDGVEISGGEAQKIAISRALYKDAPIVILDEPTSALDPISEYEIYSKFDALVQDKTSIYISHRMASCRFCDNIVVFDKGSIIQVGNHNALLKDIQGLYYKLWNAQAQYYDV